MLKQQFKFYLLSKNFTFEYTSEFSHKSAYITHQNVSYVMPDPNLLPRLIHMDSTYVFERATAG